MTSDGTILENYSIYFDIFFFYLTRIIKSNCKVDGKITQYFTDIRMERVKTGELESAS